MPQWGPTDNAANSVLWGVAAYNKPANTANKTAFYANTTLGAFIPGEVVGQFSANTIEMANTSQDFRFAQHAGWSVKTTGSGYLTGIAISAGGTGYANTDLIRVTATGTGAVNATATLTTNATGGITTITLTNPGAGFVTVNPTVAVTNASGGATSGSTATLVATAGGRAGRVSYETLVASGSNA